MHNFRSYDDDVDNVQDVLMKKEIKKRGFRIIIIQSRRGAIEGKSCDPVMMIPKDVLWIRHERHEQKFVSMPTAIITAGMKGNWISLFGQEKILKFPLDRHLSSTIFSFYFFFLNKNFVEENLTTTRIDSCFSLGFPIAFNYRHENGDTKAEIRTVVWEKTHTTSDNHHPVTLVTVKRRLSIRIWSLYERRRRGGGSSSKKLN
jgi:hypothetical protein